MKKPWTINMGSLLVFAKYNVNDYTTTKAIWSVVTKLRNGKDNALVLFEHRNHQPDKRFETNVQNRRSQKGSSTPHKTGLEGTDTSLQKGA